MLLFSFAKTFWASSTAKSYTNFLESSALVYLSSLVLFSKSFTNLDNSVLSVSLPSNDFYNVI